MPRYNLILRASTYIKLVKIAGEKGITLGKLLNQIIEEYIERYEMSKAVKEIERVDIEKHEQ